MFAEFPARAWEAQRAREPSTPAAILRATERAAARARARSIVSPETYAAHFKRPTAPVRYSVRVARGAVRDAAEGRIDDAERAAKVARAVGGRGAARSIGITRAAIAIEAAAAGAARAAKAAEITDTTGATDATKATEVVEAAKAAEAPKVAEAIGGARIVEAVKARPKKKRKLEEIEGNIVGGLEEDKEEKGGIEKIHEGKVRVMK